MKRPENPNPLTFLFSSSSNWACSTYSALLCSSILKQPYMRVKNQVNVWPVKVLKCAAWTSFLSVKSSVPMGLLICWHL